MRPPPPSRPSSLGLLVGKNKHENTYFYKQNQKKSKDNDSYHNLYETTITAQGRIQDFFKEVVVILRIQGKRSKAKGTREGEGWKWGRARPCLNIFDNLSLGTSITSSW